jgi:hypothetical protein
MSKEEVHGPDVEGVQSITLERERSNFGALLLLVVKTSAGEEHRFAMSPELAYETARHISIEAARLISEAKARTMEGS